RSTAADEFAKRCIGRKRLKRFANKEMRNQNLANSSSSKLSLHLIDVESNVPFNHSSPMAETITIYTHDFPSGINILADIKSRGIKSVDFYINNELANTETFAPYTLFGDFAGRYFGWRPSEGQFKIEAIVNRKDGSVSSEQIELIVLSESQQPPLATPKPTPPVELPTPLPTPLP